MNEASVNSPGMHRAAIAIEHADVLVIGGGPAGLSAATQARRRGLGTIVLAERSSDVGGVPRYTDHTGFGLRDRHRLMSGPSYARHLARDAFSAGVDVHVGLAATSWCGPTALRLDGLDGPRIIEARAVVLATGTRERPRAARLIPGTRPAGVHTTSALQQLVHLHHIRPGRRAVVIGAEHVSFSAIDTLAHAGCTTVAVVTGERHHQSYAPFVWAAARRRRVPVLDGVTVEEITGHGRVDGVRLSDGTVLACDTVVVSGDWIAEHELARQAGLAMASHANAVAAVAVDGALRTSAPGVFAAGNLLHGALQADWCALEGRHVVDGVARWLDHGAWPDDAVDVVAGGTLRWVAPSRLGRGEMPPCTRIVLAGSTFAGRARITMRQGDRILWRGRPRTPIVPGRPVTISAHAVGAIDPSSGAITVTDAG